MKRIEVSSGVGFPGLLALVFIVLKLVGTIHWSWLWVLAPIWAPFAAAALLIMILLFLEFVDELFNWVLHRKWMR